MVAIVKWKGRIVEYTIISAIFLLQSVLYVEDFIV